MFLFAMCVCCMQSGQPQDAKDDVKGKPESQKSKIARMFGQWFGKGAQMLADSGVIENDEANTALGAAGTMIQEQAEMDPTETSASEFTPYFLHIPVHNVTHINFNRFINRFVSIHVYAYMVAAHILTFNLISMVMGSDS